MRLFWITIIIGLITSGDLIAQGIKQVNYQFDLGTIITIPYDKTVELWPDLEGNPQTDYGSNFGYFFELLISYNLNDKLSINTGLNYNFSSISVSDKYGFLENKGKISTSYITTPIFLKFKPTDKIPISFSCGPYFGFILSANEKGTTYLDTSEIVTLENDPVLDYIDPEENYSNKIIKDYSSIDYGLVLQLDYEIIRNDKFTGVLLMRINYGLKQILTNEISNYSMAKKWKNYNIMIGLGFKI